MDKICRICSQKSSQLTSIFSFQKDRLLSDMILVICPIKIDASDDLPKNICKSCLNLILDAISLREKSVKSDLNFRSKSLALETPEIMRVSELDPFYTTAFFEDDSDDEGSKKLKRSKKSKPQSEFENDESMDEDSDDGSEYKPQDINDTSVKKRKINSEEEGRYNCPMCTSTFTFQTNVRRHIKKVHNDKIPKKRLPNTAKSNCCTICGLSFTIPSNMRRHMRTIHSDALDKTAQLNLTTPRTPKISTEIEQIFENANKLTQKYFANPLNKRYVQYLTVIDEEPNETFTYECLLCKKEDFCKKFIQSITNGSMSNYRRHLRKIHKIKDIDSNRNSIDDNIEDRSEKTDGISNNDDDDDDLVLSLI